jgi:hypothetical protein
MGNSEDWIKFVKFHVTLLYKFNFSKYQINTIKSENTIKFKYNIPITGGIQIES